VAGTDQSFVDPGDPTWLEFDYVRRVAAVVDQFAPAGQRLRCVHVGGAGMTLARYVAATRPTSAQIVFEPDAGLTAAVRAVAPLPPRCGVKVRARDGRAGLAELPDDYADIVIVDAFAGASVPGELATQEWFAAVARVLDGDGVMIMNLTDQAPLTWSRRTIAGIVPGFAAGRAGPPDRARPATRLALAVEPSTLTGRRFGNLVVAAGGRLDPAAWHRSSAREAFPYRVLAGEELTRWLGGARPFDDSDATASPPPPGGPTVFR
jgi:hypothetical protein